MSDLMRSRENNLLARQLRAAWPPAMSGRHERAWYDSHGEEQIYWSDGAAYVTRTRDPIITNDVLYQLS
jgi:hypothetical protein